MGRKAILKINNSQPIHKFRLWVRLTCDSLYFWWAYDFVGRVAVNDCFNCQTWWVWYTRQQHKNRKSWDMDCYCENELFCIKLLFCFGKQKFIIFFVIPDTPFPKWIMSREGLQDLKRVFTVGCTQRPGIGLSREIRWSLIKWPPDQKVWSRRAQTNSSQEKQRNEDMRSLVITCHYGLWGLTKMIIATMVMMMAKMVAVSKSSLMLSDKGR